MFFNSSIPCTGILKLQEIYEKRDHIRESEFQEKHTELFGTSKSIFADTIFYNGKLTSCTVPKILYHWAMGARRMKICKYVGVSAVTARSTLTA